MTAEQPVATTSEREYSLAEIRNLLSHQKWLLATIIVGLTLAAVAVALLTTPVFRAEVVAMDVGERGGMGMTPIGGQLGGLAALAGVNVGTGGMGRESSALLKSRALASEFVTRERLVPRLLEGQTENATVWFAVERLRNDVLSIDQDPRSGLVTLTVDWHDPKEAARWANDYLELADEVMRTRAATDHERNIRYLNDQIEQATSVEVRTMLFKIVEEETKKLMLARSRQDYAFLVVDPAVVPENRIAPRRALIVALGFALGVLLAILAAFARDALNDGKFRRTG